MSSTYFNAGDMFLELLSTAGCYVIICISIENFAMNNLFTKIHRGVFCLPSEGLEIWLLETLVLAENFETFPRNTFMDTFNEYVCLMDIVFPIRRVCWVFFYHVCALISPTATIALSWLGFSLIWKEVCK